MAYERVAPTYDWLLDIWHPVEKAQYPEYFARREKRKEEWIKFYQENYANLPECEEDEAKATK